MKVHAPLSAALSADWSLSPKEFALLRFLAQNVDETVHREAILLEIWGTIQHTNPNIVDQYISYPRRKLERLPTGVSLLTRRGIGFELVWRPMNALNRLSIRARITLGTLLLAAMFFGAVSVVVRQQVEVIMQNATFEALQNDATPFKTALQQEPQDPADNPGEGQLVAVINPAGVTKTSTLPASITSNMGLIDLARTDPQQLVAGGVTYLVAVETVKTGAGDWTIISARNQDESALVLTDLTAGLTAGLGALTLLFGAVSWYLTGAALRPVTQLRRSADSDRRLRHRRTAARRLSAR